MVAPKVRPIWNNQYDSVGIYLHCPTCPESPIPKVLRLESVNDYPLDDCSDLVKNPGPLGFIMRCDRCGFRVHMTGHRLATVQMLEAQDEA